MTRETVLQLAADRIRDEGIPFPLQITRVAMIEGRVTWMLDTLDKDANSSLTIDDETGRVGELKH